MKNPTLLAVWFGLSFLGIQCTKGPGKADPAAEAPNPVANPPTPQERTLQKGPDERMKDPPRVLFCRQIVEKRGVPKCLGPVTGEQQKALPWVFTATEIAHRITQVSCVNGAGRRISCDPSVTPGPTAVWEYVYYPNGDVQWIVERTASGEFVQAWQSLPMQVLERHDEEALKAFEQKKPVLAGTVLSRDGWVRKRTRYDANGCPTGVKYYDSEGKAVADSRGRWGLALTTTPDCLITGEKVLGPAYVPARDGRGIGQVQTEYTEFYLPKERRFLGPEGEIVLGDRNFATQTWTYDARGREVETWTHGVDGALILSSERIAGRTRVLDERGFSLEVWTRGLDRKPLANTFGFAGMKTRFDVHGNEIERWFHDAQDRRVTHGMLKVAGFRVEVDARGKIVRTIQYDVDGKEVQGELPTVPR